MRLATLILLAASSLAIAAPAVAENVGAATRVQRFAYQTPMQANRAPLFRLNPVVRNARLETVPAGALEVTFTDGSRLTLGSASSIIVDDYVYGGPQGTGAQTLRMTRGAFRFVSGSMPKDRVRLQTPTVTVGIRGTTVKATVNEDGSGVIFFEHGQGVVDNGKGQQVPVAEGQQVTVGADGSISSPSQSSFRAGDSAVDDGMNAFGRSFSGPNGGSGGGDGAGSSGNGQLSNPG